MISIKVEGATELALKFEQANRVMFLMAGDAMEKSLKYVQNDAQTYPSETEANRPPPPYYIRGVGTKTATVNLSESQQLGSKWVGEMETKNKGTWVGTLSNAVTYAPHVHLASQQKLFHAARGWRTVETIAQQAVPQITSLFEDAVKKVVQFLS